MDELQRTPYGSPKLIDGSTLALGAGVVLAAAAALAAAIFSFAGIRSYAAFERDRPKPPFTSSTPQSELIRYLNSWEGLTEQDGSPGRHRWTWILGVSVAVAAGTALLLASLRRRASSVPLSHDIRVPEPTPLPDAPWRREGAVSDDERLASKPRRFGWELARDGTWTSRWLDPERGAERRLMTLARLEKELLVKGPLSDRYLVGTTIAAAGTLFVSLVYAGINRFPGLITLMLLGTSFAFAGVQQFIHSRSRLAALRSGDLRFELSSFDDLDWTAWVRGQRAWITWCAGSVVVLASIAGWIADDLGQRGALAKAAVREGEWWRLLTSGFLHANVMHLFFNFSALTSFGSLAEPVVGRTRFAALFLASIVGGSVASCWLSERTGVGASGGILGLAGAMLALDLRHRGFWPRWISRALYSFFPFMAVFSLFAFEVLDHGAHLGGLATGFLLMLAMAWKRTPAGVKPRRTAPAADGPAYSQLAS